MRSLPSSWGFGTRSRASSHKNALPKNRKASAVNRRGPDCFIICKSFLFSSLFRCMAFSRSAEHQHPQPAEPAASYGRVSYADPSKELGGLSETTYRPTDLKLHNPFIPVPQAPLKELPPRAGEDVFAERRSPKAPSRARGKSNCPGEKSSAGVLNKICPYRSSLK